MEQFRERVNAILSRNARSHVNEGVAEMEGHGDINSNLEYRLCMLNVEKMRRMEKR